LIRKFLYKIWGNLLCGAMFQSCLFITFTNIRCIMTLNVRNTLLYLLLLYMRATQRRVFTITYLKQKCFYGTQFWNCYVFTNCAIYIMLFCTWNMFCTLIIAHSEMCALTSFCSCLKSCIAGILLRFCPSDYEMLSVASVISGINFAFALHIL